jgi:hypothetical protein
MARPELGRDRGDLGPRVERPLLRVASLRVVDPVLCWVDVDHPPDDSSCEHLPERLRCLETVSGRNRHSPSRDLLRAKLGQSTRAERLDCFREQPAQFPDRLRLAVVLRQVLVDQLGERQRGSAASRAANSLERPLERFARVPLGHETTPLHTPRAATTDPIAIRPKRLLVDITPELEDLTLLQHHDHSFRRGVGSDRHSDRRARQIRHAEGQGHSHGQLKLAPSPISDTCARARETYAVYR